VTGTTIVTRTREQVSPTGPLNIAVVSPPWFEVPPERYGGIESVVADLVAVLVARGHHVTLVAAGRCLTAAQTFVQTFEVPPTERLGTAVPEVLHAAAAGVALADLDLDVVHDNSLAGPLLAAGRTVPTVVTTHGPVTGEYARLYERLGGAVGLVAISRSQRSLNPGLGWIATVHNGIDVGSYPFSREKDDYLLWLGRFSHEKAPHLAIDAAREVGMPIVLAGKVNEPCEHAYMDAMIAPRLGPDVELVGEADAALKRRLLVRARALLFPIQWEEPFGIVMVEAMACGTPVVALRRGSVPEVVRHGVTGIVADDFGSFVAGIDAATDLDPDVCRRHAERYFDRSVMGSGYERVFHAVADHDFPRVGRDVRAPDGVDALA